jgi:hypothetical protein
LNWQDAFRFPDRFLESRLSEMEDLEFEVEFEYNKQLKEIFNIEKLEGFSIKDAYYEAVDAGLKGKAAVDSSMKNHFEVINEAAEDVDHALQLCNFLSEHMEHRLKHYTRCISKSTPNYLKYLIETYERQLKQMIRNQFY